MKRQYKALAMICVLMLLAVMFFSTSKLQVNAEGSSKSILILNSYHKGLSWTDNQTEGIISAIDSYDDDANIYVEYMDWKNHPTEENLGFLYELLSYKYSTKKLDVIITTDDAALSFALEHRGSLFNSAPVVFCGVNEQGVYELTKGYSGVTGVKEIIDPEGTISAAFHINPDIEEIYLLFDNTESGISTGEMTIEAAKTVKTDIKIKSLNTLSVQEVLEEAAKAPDNSIILITTYYVDSLGNAVGFEDFSRKVSQVSSAPVFHLYDFGLHNGAIGGSMISSRLLGEDAGKLAVRILEGEEPDEIAPLDPKATSFVFDYLQLRRFNIGLDKLPEASTVINNPYAFFEEYRGYIIVAATVFVLLLLLILSLSFYLIRISNIKGQLEHSHEELEASEQQLRKKLNEIIRVQQSLNESETRYSQLFDKMLNAFAIIEPMYNAANQMYDIRLIKVNPGFQQQLNKKDVNLDGKTWMELFNYPNRNMEIYKEILATGEAKHYDTYYPELNVYYSTNAFKISDTRIGVVFDNITEYKLAVKEIKKLNEELEQRVSERTEELQDAVNELEGFAYTVSHDLKSPIRAVDGYARILQEDYHDKLEEDGNELIGSIRNICRDMLEMISKLLKYSTTSKSVVVKEAIDTARMVRSVYKELSLAAEGRDIELIIETGMPVVDADKVLLRQAIYNLVSNAVKFTRHVEKAKITVGCTITGSEYVFYVRDNGAGFDMDYVHKLFGIFQRLHNNEEFEGNGIGLVTVKNIIHKHNGRVWIEGKPNNGATVYFTLPLIQ